MIDQFIVIDLHMCMCLPKKSACVCEYMERRAWRGLFKPPPPTPPAPGSDVYMRPLRSAYIYSRNTYI